MKKTNWKKKKSIGKIQPRISCFLIFVIVVNQLFLPITSHSVLAQESQSGDLQVHQEKND